MSSQTGCNRRQAIGHCEHKKGEHNHGTENITGAEKSWPVHRQQRRTNQTTVSDNKRNERFKMELSGKQV